MNESSHPILPGDRIHALLCAYLFGEVTPEERAEVESALASSSELRAEHARLSATVGLVRGAYQSEERLPEEAFARLVDRAIAGRAAPPVRRWYARPVLSAAAAVLALAGGVLGLLKLPRSGGVPRDELVAKSDGGRSEPRRESSTSALSSLGYAGEPADKSSQTRAAGEVTVPEQAASDEVVLETQLDDGGRDGEAFTGIVTAPVLEEQVDELDAAVDRLRAVDPDGDAGEKEVRDMLEGIGYLSHDADEQAEVRLGALAQSSTEESMLAGGGAGSDATTTSALPPVLQELDGYNALANDEAAKLLRQQLQDRGVYTIDPNLRYQGIAPVPESSTAAPSAGGGDQALFRMRGAGKAAPGSQDGNGTYKGPGDSAAPSSPGPAGPPPGEPALQEGWNEEDESARVRAHIQDFDIDEPIAAVLLGEERKEAEEWIGQQLYGFADDQRGGRS